MKEKLIGLISVGAMVTSLLLMTFFLYLEQSGEDFSALNAGLNLGLRSKSRGGVNSIPTVNKKVQKTIQKLQNRLQDLRIPGVPQRGRVDFEMLGYELPKAGEVPQEAEDDGFEDFGFAAVKQQVVSMTYISGTTRYAVINGKLFKEGDKVNNELRIKQITPSKVLISDLASERWIKVSNKSTKDKRRSPSSKISTAGEEKQGKDKPKNQIVKGLDAIKTYSDILKSLE